MKYKYKFWSIYDGRRNNDDCGWLCIPPSQKYIPDWYAKGCLVKKHNEVLPPPSYWLRPEYETMVYNKDY